MFKPLEIQNVIDRDYQNKIYDLVTNIDFPWHFVEDTTFEKANDLQNSTPGFSHLVFHPNNEHNPYLEFFTPLLNSILEKTNYTLDTLLRMRLGFLLNTKYALPSMPYKHNLAHRDYDQEHFTVCYYINNTDGDTYIFHEVEPSEKYRVMHRSTPEQGKMLMFNGWHYHASSCPKMFTKRIVLTINFTARKNG
jgi:hypothetical protein